MNDKMVSAVQSGDTKEGETMVCDRSPRNGALSALSSGAQDKAFGAQPSGATVTSAAKVAGVDRATLHRWLAEDTVFIAAYNAYRAEMMDAVRQELRLLAAEAVRAVRAVLADGSAPAAVRVRAAGEV